VTEAQGLAARLAAPLVLVTSAAVLVLEVLVSRLVAPYVGLTLETYTAAIGVALAAIAGGAAVGGALVLVARPTVFGVGDLFRGSGPAGTVVLVGLAAAPAVLVLSTVPPGVVKLRLRTLAETGETVGRLSAVGTLGALAGTFLTGFVLLAALPTSRLLLAVGVLLLVAGALVAVLLARTADVPPSGSLRAVAVLGALGAGWLLVADGPCQAETRYYCASLLVDPERPSGRLLVLDGDRHSYVDLDDPWHLEFGYAQRIAEAVATLPPGPLDVLYLGAGGFSLPRYVAAARPGSRATVLEVDPQVPRIARNELGLDAVPGVRVVVGDARTTIADLPDDGFDVVVGDAFGSSAVPWHLTTEEMVGEVRRVLRRDGLYALNVIDYPPLAFARAEVATLRAVLPHVAVLAEPAVLRGAEGGNVVLVGSQRPLDVAALRAGLGGREEGSVVGDPHAFVRDAEVLTDDHAPVDQLFTPYRRPRG
jgi:spermidine synthase